MRRELLPRDRLQGVEMRLVDACDGEIPVYGSLMTTVLMGGFHADHAFVVADVKNDVNLGADFLLRHDCVISLPERTLHVGGSTVKLDVGTSKQVPPSIGKESESEEAFCHFKGALTTTPILAYPGHEGPFILDTDATHEGPFILDTDARHEGPFILDTDATHEGPFSLDTDASTEGIGAVLSQVQDGKERVIEFYRKRLDKTQRRYCVTRRELLAVVEGVAHCRPYLYRRHFTLRTDHSSLQWLMNLRDPEGQYIKRMDDELGQHIISTETEVCLLDCREAFAGLSEQEKKYMHYLSQAAFHGGLICLFQTSPESPGIFLLLQKIFRAQTPAVIEDLSKSIGFTKDEVKALIIYAAGVYSNMGNYKAYGDIKFVPSLPKEKFEALVMKSTAAAADPAGIKSLLDSVLDRIFSLEEHERELEFPPKGITTYVSSNCTETDAELSVEFLVEKDISPYNTRVFKTEDPSSKSPVYEVRLASAETSDGEVPGMECPLGIHKFQGKEAMKPTIIKLTRGDYSSLLESVCENLAEAKKYASNDNEREMLDDYIKSFATGSVPAHMNASRAWIKNKLPRVETYMAFLEPYRDPFGIRGEFEAFVGVVNKELTQRFKDLVEIGEQLLPLLPWPKEFEKNRFLAPDFTSLDVVIYAGSNVYSGVNIPNYDEIRQDEGFKNLSFGNVFRAREVGSKYTFLSAADNELYATLRLQAFEVQLALHELLGHGSGKLFRKLKNETFNFDIKNVKHPETGKPITTWYEEGETFDEKFPAIGASYEECRAECVSLYLCFNPDVLRIFGHTGKAAEDIVYVIWLDLAHSGLSALEYYTPATKSWRQVHMNASYVVLQVILEAGEGFVKLESMTGEDGEPDVRLTLDRTKLESVGRPALGRFLQKMQVYKSTGDHPAARKLYLHYSEVSDNAEPHFLTIRKIVLNRKSPRRMFVQHHTFIEGNQAKLKSFPATHAGIIQSFVERFPSPALDQAIEILWTKDKKHFQ